MVGEERGSGCDSETSRGLWGRRAWGRCIDRRSVGGGCEDARGDYDAVRDGVAELDWVG